MESLATQHFDNILKCNDSSVIDISKILDCFTMFGSTNINIELDQPFTRDDVAKTVKSVHANKVLGQDGIQALFYQKFQDIVGHDVVDV